MSDVLHGDCLEIMRGMDAASVDAIVTDPPYELGFMGKGWDASGIAFNVEVWRQALRVLKPGGYLLAFGGTRTYHRMTVAIEDAGFEIRDCIGWHYGSGFPKSLDVSKAIDKIDRIGPMEARARTFTAWMRSTGITAQQVNDATETCMGSHYLTDKSQPAVATADLFDLLRPLLPPVPDEIEALVRSRTVESENMKRRKVLIERTMTQGGGTSLELRMGEQREVRADITEPHSEAAKAWDGWGTALKPAWEPVVVARKPLEGTVAANVLKHGTGALNIDGCRVNPGERVPGGGKSKRGADGGGIYGDGAADQNAQPHDAGRWPANVILSHDPSCGEECASGCPCAAMDAQSGVRTSGKGQQKVSAGAKRASGWEGTGGMHQSGKVNVGVRDHGDNGGASRFFNQLAIEADDLVPFFYTPKASRSEREAGCSELPERSGEVRNHHPTVKPISVMEWCIRLVTRECALVLDPFCGSGTTGAAAVRLGRRFIGCEQSAEYVEIARARIAHHGRQLKLG